MPAYNRAHTIAESIESILAQTFTDFEVIVVDDGSTDETISILGRYPKVRLLAQENSGPGAARNLAVKSANGQFLAFLDSDDLWLPWTLDHFRRVITQENAVFVSGAGVEFVGEAPKLEENGSALDYSVHPDYLSAGATGVWIGTCGAAISRELFNSVGGFVDKFINAEDSDLWMKLGVASPFVRINSPATFLYRRSATSATSDISRTVDGARHLLGSEKQGIYPGGHDRKRERSLILGKHLRPVCISSINHGGFREAAEIYAKSFAINLKTARFKFLFCAPALAVYRYLTQKRM